MNMKETLPDPQRPPLSLKKKLIFSFVPLFLLILLSEFALSAVNPEAVLVRVDDPETVYSFYPERRGVIQTEEFRAEVETNQLGMRDCVTPADASGPGTEAADTGFEPVLFIGDSFTEGWGVSCSEIFPVLFREHYSGPVHNGGIHGGSPPAYVLLAREHLRRTGAKKIIIQIFDNDLYDSRFFYQFLNTNEDQSLILSARPPSLGPIPGGWLTRKIRELSWYRLGKRVYKKMTGKPEPIKYYRPGRYPEIPILSQQESLEKHGFIKSLTDPDNDYGGQFGFYRFRTLNELNKNPEWAESVRLFTASLNQLIKESSLQAEVYLLYIPAKEVFAEGGIIPNGADGLKMNPMAELLKEISASNGIKLLDAREALKSDPNQYYFPRDAHLNSKGHRTVSDLIKKDF